MSGSKSSDLLHRVPESHRAPPFELAEARPQDAIAPDTPLGLTVHTLPAPGQAGVALADARRTRRGRLKMLGLLLICALPVMASYFTYYVLRPAGRTNYGELIAPPRPLPAALAGTDLAGHSQPLGRLRGQWLLLSVGGGACNALCEKNLYLQRQLREALGKNKERLDRVWLISDQAPVPAALRPALAQASVLLGQPLDAHLYLVDPLGHWMMRFPPHMDMADAARAKRDLDKLLRASAAWDEPGRGGMAPVVPPPLPEPAPPPAQALTR